jgi:hypothetical protein
MMSSTEPQEDLGKSAILKHCEKVYAAMLEKSEPHTYKDEEVQRYVGFTTQLFEEVGLATPYYTSVMNALKKMECCVQAKRGGGGSPSVWILLRPPTEELFMEKEHLISSRVGNVEERMNQKFNDLNKRLSSLEGQVRALVEKALGGN